MGRGVQGEACGEVTQHALIDIPRCFGGQSFWLVFCFDPFHPTFVYQFAVVHSGQNGTKGLVLATRFLKIGKPSGIFL